MIKPNARIAVTAAIAMASAASVAAPVALTAAPAVPAVPAAPAALSAAPAVEEARPRNIILLIGDGMSIPQRMMADEFSRRVGGGALAMNTMPYEATTRTPSASSLVTDSAAAATAIACGEKTNNGVLGLDACGGRLESCAEVAKKEGMAVGIVTSVTINHATPAGFYAHQADRSMLYEIGLDLVRSGFDLFMGGGLAQANSMTDNVAENVGDLYEYAATNGWLVLEGRGEFSQVTAAERGRRVWWRSGEEALPYAIDAADEPDTPRLPEITAAAIARLDGESASSPKGFFLMVEGGSIDWSGHSNDAATNLRDMLEFDKAVQVALDFQSAHPDTLVVVTGDHETGGMSMGFAGTGYAFYMERLAAQKSSTRAFRKRLAAKRDDLGRKFKFEDALAMVEENYGLKAEGDEEKDPMVFTDKELESLERYFPDAKDFSDKVRRVMQSRAGVGWTSGAHTGLPALTTSVGPGGKRFTGLLENTDIARIIKSLCCGR